MARPHPRPRRSLRALHAAALALAAVAAAVLLALPLGAQTPAPRRPTRRGPVPVVIGAAIGGVHLGMTRASIQAMGYVLSPEPTARAEGTGWVAGALLFIVDTSDRVTVVSLDLRRSAGMVVAGRTLPRTATLADIARAVPGCTQSQGSGGNALECRDAAGHATHFYDSFMRDEVTVSMP